MRPTNRYQNNNYRTIRMDNWNNRNSSRVIRSTSNKTVKSINNSSKTAKYRSRATKRTTNNHCGYDSTSISMPKSSSRLKSEVTSLSPYCKSNPSYISN